MTLTVRWWQTKSMVLVIVEAMVVAMVVVLKVEMEVVRMVANPETYAGVRWSDLYGLARHCANPHPLDDDDVDDDGNVAAVAIVIGILRLLCSRCPSIANA
uniref:Uncharacterized protein n=1 Tax=Vespula pensylvanica TaxID=30213 RepID=A0A834UGK3_VESPE|nr:hypothetical protein H0235_000603 [Vespula pensylvanica]